MFEASMNFDMDDVEPFLNELEDCLNLGLPVTELAAFARSTAIDTEGAKTLSVCFCGQAIVLEYRVFMDDVDAPDLYFVTPSKGLSNAIDAELKAFADRHGL